MTTFSWRVSEIAYGIFVLLSIGLLVMAHSEQRDEVIDILYRLAEVSQITSYLFVD